MAILLHDEELTRPYTHKTDEFRVTVLVKFDESLGNMTRFDAEQYFKDLVKEYGSNVASFQVLASYKN